MSMSWLRKVAHGPRPFFAYIAPKACHEPFTPAAWFVDFYVHLWVWAPVCSKSVVGQFLKPPKLLLFLVVVTMRQLVSSMHIFLKHSIAIGAFNACISQAFDWSSQILRDCASRSHAVRYADYWDPSWPATEPRPVSWNASFEDRADHHGVIATNPMISEKCAEYVSIARAKFTMPRLD